MTVKSNFKLDDRIKSIDDIQTILCNNNEFVGCKGFFFDNFVQAKNLTKHDYGTLVDIDVKNSDDHCFKARDKNGNERIGYYRFFIPEKLLKPVEKKYRPYTLAEWIDQHEIGEVIHYRNKSEGIEFRLMYTGYAHGIGKNIKDVGVGAVTLGLASYTLDYFFDYYEIEINGEWRPFGVIEE